MAKEAALGQQGAEKRALIDTEAVKREERRKQECLVRTPMHAFYARVFSFGG